MEQGHWLDGKQMKHTRGAPSARNDEKKGYTGRCCELEGAKTESGQRVSGESYIIVEKMTPDRTAEILELARECVAKNHRGC